MNTEGNEYTIEKFTVIQNSGGCSNNQSCVGCSGFSTAAFNYAISGMRVIHMKRNLPPVKRKYLISTSLSKKRGQDKNPAPV